MHASDLHEFKKVFPFFKMSILKYNCSEQGGDISREMDLFRNTYIKYLSARRKYNFSKKNYCMDRTYFFLYECERKQEI